MTKNLTYSLESVQSDIKELVNTFSNFDSFSKNEQKAYTINNYIPKITNIASFLNKSSKENKLSLLIEKCSKDPDFDPRYVSKYSSKWNQEPDERSKINQGLIDLESRLNIEDSPEARFVLFNALRDISENYVEPFELKKIKASKTDFKSLCKYLTQDFDVIEMKKGQRSKNKTRLTRKEFELYVLGELKNKIFKIVSIEDKYKIFDLKDSFCIRRIRNNGLFYDEYYGSYDFCDLYKITYRTIFQIFKKNNLKFSDISVEEFIKTQKNNLLNAILFNYLFNSCVRTKIDFKVEKDMNYLLYSQNGLFGRNLIFNGNGFRRFENSKKIFVKNLEANGVGKHCFSGSENVNAEKLEANGDGDMKFFQAHDLFVKTLKANGKGNARFAYSKNIITETLEANEAENMLFHNYKNLIAETLEANGNGRRRFEDSINDLKEIDELKKNFKKILTDITNNYS